MAPPLVVFVTPGSFPIPSPNSSSVERVVEHLVPLLARQRVEPRIYGRISRRLKRVGSVRGVPCERFPAASRAAYVRAAVRAAAKAAPRVIQVENRPLVALSMKRRFPQRSVWLSLQSSTFIGPRYIGSATLRRSLAAVDRILVNSDYLRRTVASRVPEAAGKIAVVHLGVDTRRFPSRFSPEGEQRRGELRAARGWTSRKVVLFMGRVIPRKGVHHLLAVLPELAAAHPDALLVIVGSPFYGSHRTTAYSRRLARTAKAMAKHVQFVPYVPYTDVPDWFLAADVAVVPSGRNEAFGLVNVEAMACGLPVVATRAGGMPEIVEDGMTGYLVEHARIEAELFDRLRRLLGDEALRSRMGMASRLRVEERFTWQRSAEAWLRLFEEGI